MAASMRKTKKWKEAAEAFRLASKFDDKGGDLKEKVLESPFHAYLYSREVEGGVWNEAEKAVLGDLACFFYARDVVKGRWEPAEPFISRDPMLSFMYAEECLKGRFEMGEDSISKSSFWLSKYAELLGRLPEKLHSVAALMSFEREEEWIKEYFKKNDKSNG
jgi:hypothetical protein